MTPGRGGPRSSEAAHLLWYVAYGSNVLESRFRCYLQGGRPEGARRATPGARDRRPPADDRRFGLPHPLVFGGPSATWDGGPAFLDVDRDGEAIGRGWLITVEQFADVVVQENGLEPGMLTLAPEVIRGGGVVLPQVRYSRVAPLGTSDGIPMVTVTCHQSPAPRAPDPAYVALIRQGLQEIGVGQQAIDRLLS